MKQSRKESIKDFFRNLGPNFYMFVIWVLTNFFWIGIVVFLVFQLSKPVDISQQQDLPNQYQTQHYKFGK